MRMRSIPSNSGSIFLVGCEVGMEVALLAGLTSHVQVTMFILMYCMIALHRWGVDRLF